MSVDELCEKYSRKETKLTVKFLDGERDMILIEGKASALEFLGKLLIAQQLRVIADFRLLQTPRERLFSRPTPLWGFTFIGYPARTQSVEFLPTIGSVLRTGG